MAIVTLKKRPEFLSVRGGTRASVTSFLMEAKRRPEGHKALAGPRFGFTVTKKLGGAVVRNRIRRRIKSAIAEVSAEGARDGFDYVIVARAAALERPYQEILSDVRRAFSLIHKNPGAAAAKPANRLQDASQPLSSRKIPGT